MKNKNPFSLSTVEAVCFLCAASLSIALDAVISVFTSAHPAIIAIFSIAILSAACMAYLVIRKNAVRAKKRSPLPETINILAQAIVDLPHPAFVCMGKDDRIIWSNKAAGELFGNPKCKFFELFSTLEGEDSKIRLGAKERRFCPHHYSFEDAEGREYNAFIMEDVTEADLEKVRLFGKESAIAYITVDNLDELLNYEQEDYRSASGETEKTLREWAQQAGGVLKEYQQDKYIFVFERSNLERFTSCGFDILDRIRNIRVGENSIPLTVSMGISAIDGTPLEREKSAQSALDTALQRGGDQVVLKTNGSTDIFGGKTKLPQKRTKVRARVVANELISHISSSTNVIIMGHKFADFDAFGACIGLARLSMFCGVPVSIVTDFDNSNLDLCRSWIETHKDYAGVFVDSDTALDLVTTDTLLIIADVNNRYQFECAPLADHCQRVAVIDHHRKTADFEKEPIITYIEPAASAASELVAEMLEQVIPSDIVLATEANLMMAGILLDTNQFTKNTGTRTFSAALYLRGLGADVGEVQELFKTELSDFVREMKFHSNIELYRKVTAIATAQGECTMKDKIPAAKAADKLLGIEGVKASFAVVPIGNEVHISARSTGKINVQLILERLKGGGHFDSAGTRLEGVETTEAVELLKGAIDAYFKENPQSETM